MTPNWTFAALRVALSGMKSLSAADAAAALAAQTTTSIVDVSTTDARALLLKSGEWGKLVRYSRMTPADALPAQVIEVCITMVDSLSPSSNLTIIEAKTDDDWTAIQQVCGGLQAAGILSASTTAALLALRVQTKPVWVPAPTEQDVLGARAMEQ